MIVSGGRAALCAVSQRPLVHWVEARRRRALPKTRTGRFVRVGNLPNKVLAAEYRTVLPDEKLIAADLQKTRRMLEQRGLTRAGSGEGLLESAKGREAPRTQALVGKGIGRDLVE